MGITLGISLDQLIRKLGEPKLFKGSIMNAQGQVVEVYEYDVDTGKSSAQIASEIGYGILVGLFGGFIFTNHQQPHIKPAWFYFHDNRLVRWSAAGNWAEENRIIYQMQFI